MFKVNDIVVILCTGNKYQKYNLQGKIGIITHAYPNQFKNNSSYGVRVDECRNPNSKQGSFWLPPSNIRPATPEEISEFEGTNSIEEEKENLEMRNRKPFIAPCSARVSIGENSASFVAAVFGESATKIQPGDNVVLCRDETDFTLAVVLSVDSFEVPSKVYSEGVEVVSVIDTEEFEKRVKDRARAEELKKTLDEEMKKAQEVQMYELMAQTNPAMRSLLDEYKSLIGV